MHTVANRVAEGLTVLDVAPSREESERRIASVSTGRFRRPVMVLGIDGAYVPTRPDSAREPQKGPRRTRAKRARWRGQWRDAKGLRFYLLDGERIVGLDHGVGHFRPLSITRQRHLLAYHGTARSYASLCQVF